MKEEFRIIPKSVQVVAGESIVLQCSAPKSQPEATIRWLKEGQPLAAAPSGPDSLYASADPTLLDGVLNVPVDTSLDTLERVKVLSSGALRILNVQLADRARYSCVAENMAASRESPPALLSVYRKYTPHFIIRIET
jgi:hypothetical protein